MLCHVGRRVLFLVRISILPSNRLHSAFVTRRTFFRLRANRRGLWYSYDRGCCLVTSKWLVCCNSHGRWCFCWNLDDSACISWFFHARSWLIAFLFAVRDCHFLWLESIFVFSSFFFRWCFGSTKERGWREAVVAGLVHISCGRSHGASLDFEGFRFWAFVIRVLRRALVVCTNGAWGRILDLFT